MNYNNNSLTAVHRGQCGWASVRQCESGDNVDGPVSDNLP